MPAVSSITKYAVLVERAEDIRYHLEKALYFAQNGRPGPVWLDVPLDVQGSFVETDALRGFTPEETAGPPQLWEAAAEVAGRLFASERPLLFPGNGVRLSGAADIFRKFARTFGIPVVVNTAALDAFPAEDPLFAGALDRLRVSVANPELIDSLEAYMFDEHHAEEAIIAEAYLNGKAKGEADGRVEGESIGERKRLAKWRRLLRPWVILRRKSWLFLGLLRQKSKRCSLLQITYVL